MCGRCILFRSVVLYMKCSGGLMCVLVGECFRAWVMGYGVGSVCGCSCWEVVCDVGPVDGSVRVGFGV